MWPYATWSLRSKTVSVKQARSMAPSIYAVGGTWGFIGNNGGIRLFLRIDESGIASTAYYGRVGFPNALRTSVHHAALQHVREEVCNAGDSYYQSSNGGRYLSATAIAESWRLREGVLASWMTVRAS